MDILQAIRQTVGEHDVLTGQAAAACVTGWRERYSGQALAVVRPGTTDEAARVMRQCADAGVPVIPQGGNTSLCGAATPDDSGTAVVLSMTRMNRIRDIDLDNNTLVAEAGCTLRTVQQAAEQVERLFPLSLASEDHCTIGGNLATNAGGTQVLRYGTTRHLALGLEVITPQGEIWHGLRGLRKDNTGYDLRDLYIGSEGTLGLITAVTLQLFPRPAARCTALLALASPDAAVALLTRARSGFDALLTGFELIADDCLRLVETHFPQMKHPFGDDGQPWYALLELSDSEGEAHARARFEAVIGQARRDGIVQDGIIAGTTARSRELWHLRETIPLAEKAAGKSLKHDIGVPTSRLATFVDGTARALQEQFPGTGLIVFGHLGDGNLHYNVTTGRDWSEADLLARQDDVAELVYGRVHAAGGTISAEHGIGQLKRDKLAADKGDVAIGLMQAIKQALDPHNRMNPGKVLP